MAAGYGPKPRWLTRWWTITSVPQPLPFWKTTTHNPRPYQRVHPSPLIINQRPPPARAVGGYNHHRMGEEVEWRPPLLDTYPLGHRILAKLKNQRFKKQHAEDIAAVRCAVRVFTPV